MTRLLKIVLVLCAFAVIMSSTAWADTKEIESIDWDRYKADTYPGKDTLGGSPWGDSLIVDDFTSGKLRTPIEFNGSQTKWLGVDNIPVSTNIKYLTVWLRGSHLDKLKFDSAYGVIDGVERPGGNLTTVEHHPEAINWTLYFLPQPDWEVIGVTSTDPTDTVEITHFYVSNHCVGAPVPSLTKYGLGALVLLLIAATIFVYRRRHRVIA
ncbi:MAG: hypothetical protein NT002_08850 [candidate division Zixibacteria bacterium]|nr:hypothetical protein [candidate division Zixibacteria bacterium]